jgi:putative ABC transport system permease protein
MKVRRVLSLLFLGLRRTVARPGSAGVVVLGSAGAVAVLCFFMAVNDGLQSAMLAAGRDDRALVLRRGSDSELNSLMTLQVRDLLVTEQGTAGSAEQSFSRELVRVINLRDSDSGKIVAYPIRGVGDQFQQVRPEVRIVEGRMFNPGSHEFIVGQGIVRAMPALRVGEEMPIKGVKWRIVGIFSSGGSTHDSEIFTDRETLRSFYQATHISSVTVKVGSPAALAALKQRIEADRQQSLQVISEADYYNALATRSSAPLKVVTALVGTLMAIAAVFAAMNAIHVSVSSRSSELRTLSAIGFDSNSIVMAQVLEAVLLCLLGACLGALLTWSMLGGSSISLVVGAARLNQTSFDLQVTAEAVAYCMLIGVLVGIAAGLPPAIRSVRMSAADIRFT